MVNSFVMTSKNALTSEVESYRRWQVRSISMEVACAVPRNLSGQSLVGRRYGRPLVRREVAETMAFSGPMAYFRVTYCVKSQCDPHRFCR